MGRSAEIPEEKRCIFMRAVRDADGNKTDERVRCNMYRSPGLTVCIKHGGGTKAARAKSERAKIVMSMQKFVTPIAADDPEANPIAAFEMEFRRTLGRIRYFDEKLAELDEASLVWGKTKHETGSGFEGGPNTTYESQANLYHELQFRERQHLMAMEKIWIGAKLDSRRLEIERDKVALLDMAITKILTRLGHDPRSPEVRNAVRQELLALPGERERVSE
jgi:hypothetical protein